MRFLVWKVWNRTRYYCPQAKSRKRALEYLRAGAESYGMDWDTYRKATGMRRRPWWIP